MDFNKYQQVLVDRYFLIKLEITKRNLIQIEHIRFMVSVLFCIVVFYLLAQKKEPYRQKENKDEHKSLIQMQDYKTDSDEEIIF